MKTRSVVVVGFDGMELMNLVGPTEVLNAGTQLLHSQGKLGGYAVTTASVGGNPIRGSSGVRVLADRALGNIPPATVDTLIVGGGLQIDSLIANERLTIGVERISRKARRTCSVCTGAFALAAAGLLNGRQATTHWAFGAELARRYPSVSVTPDRLSVRDGQIITSAGFSAGMDLALALIEEDHGPETARTVARWAVMFLQRPGGQSQCSERLALPATLSSPIRAVADTVVANPAADHRTPALASHIGISERHLRRVFSEQANTTPARFVERVRVEAAQVMLERNDAPIQTIAIRCGFGTAETMRRAFLRVLSIGPAEYRARFAASAAVPAQRRGITFALPTPR